MTFYTTADQTHLYTHGGAFAGILRPFLQPWLVPGREKHQISHGLPRHGAGMRATGCPSPYLQILGGLSSGILGLERFRVPQKDDNWTTAKNNDFFYPYEPLFVLFFFF